MEFKSFFLRKEARIDEYRTPLTPEGVLSLVQAGYTVVVQRSPHRIYTDDLYERVGALICEYEWHEASFKSCLILGLKELNAIDSLNKHAHAYFSHALKGQVGSNSILDKFIESKSKLYDFEYCTSPEGKRLISFGWYAGIVGAVLGIQQYRQQVDFEDDLIHLSPWTSIAEMIESVEPLRKEQRIAVIGWRGRCGSGVCHMLDTLQISYDRLGKDDSLDLLHTYDIIYNCILLDETYMKKWFSLSSVLEKRIILVDISCDYSKPNNPVDVYTKATTWLSPVLHPVKGLSLIAIENLPSLLPKESSDYFSKCFVELLFNHPDCFERALRVFQHHI
jgi:saccharopine dehydrogenase (NAD+, L-lysine forming)